MRSTWPAAGLHPHMRSTAASCITHGDTVPNAATRENAAGNVRILRQAGDVVLVRRFRSFLNTPIAAMVLMLLGRSSLWLLALCVLMP